MPIAVETVLLQQRFDFRLAMVIALATFLAADYYFRQMSEISVNPGTEIFAWSIMISMGVLLPLVCLGALSWLTSMPLWNIVMTILSFLTPVPLGLCLAAVVPVSKAPIAVAGEIQKWPAILVPLVCLSYTLALSLAVVFSVDIMLLHLLGVLVLLPSLWAARKESTRPLPSPSDLRAGRKTLRDVMRRRLANASMPSLIIMLVFLPGAFLAILLSGLWSFAPLLALLSIMVSYAGLTALVWGVRRSDDMIQFGVDGLARYLFGQPHRITSSPGLMLPTMVYSLLYLSLTASHQLYTGPILLLSLPVFFLASLGAAFRVSAATPRRIWQLLATVLGMLGVCILVGRSLIALLGAQDLYHIWMHAGVIVTLIAYAGSCAGGLLSRRVLAMYCRKRLREEITVVRGMTRSGEIELKEIPFSKRDVKLPGEGFRSDGTTPSTDTDLGGRYITNLDLSLLPFRPSTRIKPVSRGSGYYPSLEFQLAILPNPDLQDEDTVSGIYEVVEKLGAVGKPLKQESSLGERSTIHHIVHSQGWGEVLNRVKTIYPQLDQTCRRLLNLWALIELELEEFGDLEFDLRRILSRAIKEAKDPARLGEMVREQLVPLLKPHLQGGGTTFFMNPEVMRTHGESAQHIPMILESRYHEFKRAREQWLASESKSDLKGLWSTYYGFSLLSSLEPPVRLTMYTGDELMIADLLHHVQLAEDISQYASPAGEGGSPQASRNMILLLVGQGLAPQIRSILKDRTAISAMKRKPSGLR